MSLALRFMNTLEAPIMTPNGVIFLSAVSRIAHTSLIPPLLIVVKQVPRWSCMPRIMAHHTSVNKHPQANDRCMISVEDHPPVLLDTCGNGRAARGRAGPRQTVAMSSKMHELITLSFTRRRTWPISTVHILIWRQDGFSQVWARAWP